MTKWTKDKADTLKRDLLRDFCLAAACLEEQFQRFDSSGALSFSIISSVVGNEFNKGLLWRIKDTAHHLFSDKSALSGAGNHLDWTLGFLFHECLQLLESAYQLQYYAPRLAALPAPGGPGGLEDALFGLSGQSRASLQLHIARARSLIAAANELFCRYLKGDGANRTLARLIYDREDLLRQVFGKFFQHLLDSVYGKRRERVFLEAAVSLAEIGYADKAAVALRKALEVNPGNTQALRLLSEIRP